MHWGEVDSLLGGNYESRSSTPKGGDLVLARSHLPLLDYEAQVDLMQLLAEGVAPQV